jgi:hypothetical protein
MNFVWPGSANHRFGTRAFPLLRLRLFPVRYFDRRLRKMQKSIGENLRGVTTAASHQKDTIPKPAA